MRDRKHLVFAEVEKLLDAARGGRYVTSLRDDVLPGTPGEPQHSYVGMMTTNVTTMVEALGGDTRAVARCVER